MSSTLNVRYAALADIPALMALSRNSAQETGTLDIYDEARNRTHLTDLLTRGVGFVVCIDKDLIGAALLTPIETESAVLKHLESAHLFVRTDSRSMPVVRALLRAIGKHCTREDIVALMHQVSYTAAIEGRTTETRRVGTLFKRLFGGNSYGVTYVIRPDKSLE